MIDTQIEEKIQKIKKEIKETPYHKGTQHHIGLLRARLARLEDELIQREQKSGGGGLGLAVKKQGEATVMLLGFPSVGKSTLLNCLTQASSKVADYAFTTVEVIPGMLIYQGAQIQIMDIPGFLKGAALGKGKGKQILSLIRAADLLLLVVDSRFPEQINIIKNELYQAGIRINSRPPLVFLKPTIKGGVKVYLTPNNQIEEDDVIQIAQEFKISNAEIYIKEKINFEQLVDGFCKNRVYIKALVCANKIDLVDKNLLAQLPNDWLKISAKEKIGLENLKKTIWDTLEFIRVYLKPKDGQPDFVNPLILKKGQTVLDAAKKIHGEMAAKIKEAKVWGKSVKYPGQTVSLTHQLKDEDILTLI